MKVVDLTLSIYEGMPCFPVEWYPKPKFEHILHVDNDPTGSNRYASKALIFCHGGTHLDSPMHYNYFDCKKTIDKVLAETLVNETVWIHISGKKELEAITDKDIETALNGKEIKGKGLLITTGYTDENWGSENYFEVSPYLSTEAAQFMVDKGITMVSIDFQTDKPGDAAFPVHNILLSKEIYILEYITNVKELFNQNLSDEFILSVGVLKLENLEAAPARVFAIEK